MNKKDIDSKIKLDGMIAKHVDAFFKALTDELSKLFKKNNLDMDKIGNSFFPPKYSDCAYVFERFSVKNVKKCVFVSSTTEGMTYQHERLIILVPYNAKDFKKFIDKNLVDLKKAFVDLKRMVAQDDQEYKNIENERTEKANNLSKKRTYEGCDYWWEQCDNCTDSMGESSGNIKVGTGQYETSYAPWTEEGTETYEIKETRKCPCCHGKGGFICIDEGFYRPTKKPCDDDLYLQYCTSPKRLFMLA